MERLFVKIQHFFVIISRSFFSFCESMNKIMKQEQQQQQQQQQ